MLLTIKYKNGDMRRINLHQSFFTTYDVSIPKRASDFAYMHGKEPYQIVVYRGNDILHETTIRQNAPDRKEKPYNIDEKKVKKTLRNKHKREVFTTKVIL